MLHPYGNPQHFRSQAPPPSIAMNYCSPRFPSSSAPDVSFVPTAAVRRNATARSAQGHFSKQDGKVSIILADQKEGTHVPVYGMQSVVTGFISITDPEDVLHLELTMEGHIRTKEVAEGGTTDVELFNETLILWDVEDGGWAPVLHHFNCGIPTHYIDNNGLRLAMPPTYHTRLNGIPGFNVVVEYHLMLTVNRRTKLRNRTKRIKVPFMYKPRLIATSYPPLPPSDLSLPANPKHVFVSWMMPRQVDIKPITVYLFLPLGRICSFLEPIPFRLRLTGTKESLAPFMFIPPAESSIHPLSSEKYSMSLLPSATVDTAKALRSLKEQILGRSCDLADLIRIRVERQTFADAKSPVCLCSDSHLSCMKVIGQGHIQETDKNHYWINCSGKINISPEVDCGSFVAEGLTVADAIVLTIASPGIYKGSSPFTPFRQAVPIRLVTDRSRPRVKGKSA